MFCKEKKLFLQHIITTMNYTTLTLSLLGMLGIIIHNLVKLNSLNRLNDGQINIGKYWALEKFSIFISICVIIVALIARAEIKQLENVGKWLGLGFVTLGYMAQSIVVTFMGRAQKFIDTKKEN